MRNEHVFEISPKVWLGLTVEEINATVADMKELGIYHRPHDGPIVIRTPLSMPDSWGGEDIGLSDENWSEVLFDGDVGRPAIVRKVDKYVDPDEMLRKARAQGLDAAYEAERRAFIIYPTDLDPAEAAFTFDALIVLLASKGVEKKTKFSKLAALGIGKKRPSTITTISLSAYLPDDADGGHGGTKRPHLRRGHIRNQHYGKANAMTKRIWIEPMFVSGDSTFFDTRKQYRITR